MDSNKFYFICFKFLNVEITFNQFILNYMSKIS